MCWVRFLRGSGPSSSALSSTVRASGEGSTS
nr:MAG TPA: hypothetical protein [Caudoviricetes sp.]